jgi:hypothetical protein
MGFLCESCGGKLAPPLAPGDLSINFIRGRSSSTGVWPELLPRLPKLAVLERMATTLFIEELNHVHRKVFGSYR